MTEDCEQRLKGGLCPTAMPFIVSNQGEQERFEKFTKEIVNTFMMMKDNKVFMSTIIDDHKMFDIKRFEVDAMSEFVGTLKEFIAKSSEIKDIDYPEEFLDPIMFCKIETPMMLPGIDNIFIEKSVIEKHLLTEETNPFNRDKLTIQDLETYNQTPNIKQKTMEFKNKMDIWQKENVK